MSALAGSRLGSFEIQTPLGRGGMGEVYQARDLELGRTVAIKLLRPEIARDPDLLQRFRREAKVLASLNHPHIAQIYGVVEGNPGAEGADPPRGLVLELVDGDTLEDCIWKRRLATREALTVARQIADALDAAHAQGIVHRDLKPANVKITPSGAVKVLDFGVATTTSRGSSSDTTELATLAGTIIGTPAYMSPEQARGLDVDKRSDVWAFGCVLYELLTGRRAFGGATTADTLGALLHQEPDWSSLPADTTADVRRLLRRCLQKNAAERLRDMGDVRVLIDDALGAAPEVVSATAPRRSLIVRAALAAALLVAIVLIVVGSWYSRDRMSGGESMRLSVSTPGRYLPESSVAVSPDGRSLAFVSSDLQGTSMLWVRSLSSSEARPLSGTQAAAHPFWSPDSRSLGFIAGGKLKRIDIVGGRPQVITDAVRGGGAWGRGNTILYHANYTTGLHAIPAAGGPSVEVTHVDAARGEMHSWAQFLPDGRRFLYFASNTDPSKRGVYMGSLDSPERTRLFTTDFRAFYAPPGYLLFIRGESLMAQPIDIDRGELTGEARRIADDVWVAQPAAQASFSVSQNGVLAFVNAALWNTQLGWFDRQGRPLGLLGPPDRYYGDGPEISPDGTSVAIARGPMSQMGEDIWILDTRDGASRRLTFNPDADYDPAWSPDGKRLAFRARSAGSDALVVANADGTGRAETIARPNGACRSLDWSADGKFVIYCAPGENRLPDIWFVALDGDRQPTPFLQSPATEYTPQLSPDGHWLAYASNELGREEVFVQRFPEGGSKRQISSNGGAQPRWRGDGRELFFLGIDAQVMAVAVSSGTAFEASAPTALFQSQMPGATFKSAGYTYDVTPDGQKFLANFGTAELGPAITVITNWQAALTE